MHTYSFGDKMDEKPCETLLPSIKGHVSISFLDIIISV